MTFVVSVVEPVKSKGMGSNFRGVLSAFCKKICLARKESKIYFNSKKPVLESLFIPSHVIKSGPQVFISSSLSMVNIHWIISDNQSVLIPMFKQLPLHLRKIGFWIYRIKIRHNVLYTIYRNKTCILGTSATL